MLIRLWILGISIAVASSELTGNNICEIEESYAVNVTEYSWRNATVRNYKWCMGFPPRCSFYTFKTVRVPNIVEKNTTRFVKRCCSGYAENSKHDGCVECKKCFYGVCGNDGKCICNSGFKGDQCGEACEAMQWGIDCQFKCSCERGNCDPRTGRCDCPSGWFGTRCELVCLEGFYGKHCMHRCNCGERELCSSQTGQCVTKSTQHQEHQSTRAIHYLREDILNFTRMIDKQKSTPSLKKYHTFDMELSTNIPLHSKITKIPKFYVNRNEQWKPTTSKVPLKISTSNITNRKKTNGRNREISKITAKDDYVESTTEVSVEIEHNEEHLPILNENESLERKDSFELSNTSQERQHIKKYDISEIISTKEEISSEISGRTNDEIVSKGTRLKLQNSNGEKYPKKENDKDVGQTQLQFETTTQTNVTNTNQNQIDSPKLKNYTGSSTTSNGKKMSRTEIKKNEKKHGGDTVRDSRRQDITNTKVSVPTRSGSSREITTKPESNNHQGIPESIETTTYPKESRRYDLDSKEVKGIQTTSESNEFLINISPALESTSPIFNTKQPYMEHGNRNEEEDKLQNLDTMNILTSIGTSTPVSIEQDTVHSKGERILPFFEEKPSTKSTPILSSIENELYTTSSSESRAPLKDSSDYRQKKEDDNYLSDEITGEFEYSSKENSSLVTHVSIAVFTSFILVIIMTIIFLVHYYTRRRRRKPTSKIRSEHYSGGPTVSVFTHSIFHTPLPDPPTFENPVFTTPIEHSIDHRTFQTHLVCSLNLPRHNREDEKEYTYDHPPSTGSYRAASIPEPSDLNEAVPAEPLYDEIPSNMKENKTIHPGYKSSCIYVNTCGKTKF